MRHRRRIHAAGGDRTTRVREQWSLYWRDRNLKFHEYDLAEPGSNVQNLLDEIDHDPTAIFWG